VRFDGYVHPFLVLKYVCEDPQCTCNSLLLEFTEINEDGHLIARPILFSISFNVSTWKEYGKPERRKVPQHFADLFMENLTDDLKRQLTSVDDSRGRKNTLRSPSFKMSADEIKGGMIVPYREVFGELDHTEPGKAQFEFSFQYQGTNYFVEDLYCMNPECDCATAHLNFFQYEPEKAKAHQIFICNFSFEGKLEIETVIPPLTEQEAAKLFESWKQEEPDLLELVKERYQQIKDAGRQLLKESKKKKPSAKVKRTIAGKKKKKKRKK